MAKVSSKSTTCAVKQRRNSAKGPKGRPFEKGNPHAFKRGQSGNPTGRPKSQTLSEDLRARLKEQYPGKDDTTYGQMLAHKLVDLAIEGDIYAIKEIFDRTEGKPRQTVDVNIEERKRAMVEDAIACLMAQAQISRDEAIDHLMLIVPEMDRWMN